jgi:hypothetical protein
VIPDELVNSAAVIFLCATSLLVGRLSSKKGPTRAPTESGRGASRPATGYWCTTQHYAPSSSMKSAGVHYHPGAMRAGATPGAPKG